MGISNQLSWMADGEELKGEFAQASLSLPTTTKQPIIGMAGKVQLGKYQFLSTPELILTNSRLVFLEKSGGARTQAIFSPLFLRWYLPHIRAQNVPSTLHPDPVARLRLLCLPQGTADDWVGGWGGSNFFRVVFAASRSEGLLGPKSELELSTIQFRPPEAIQRLGARGGFLNGVTARQFSKLPVFSPVEELYLKVHDGAQLDQIVAAVTSGSVGMSAYIADTESFSRDYYADPQPDLLGFLSAEQARTAGIAASATASRLDTSPPAANAEGASVPSPAPDGPPRPIPQATLLDLRRRVIMLRAGPMSASESEREQLKLELQTRSQSALPNDRANLAELLSLLG